MRIIRKMPYLVVASLCLIVISVFFIKYEHRASEHRSTRFDPVLSECDRITSLIGTKPTLAKIHAIWGAPDHSYSGSIGYKEELSYEKVSSKIDVLLLIADD